ncbi:MAG: toll/interleukin-1 receptor domain-containing protein [Chloroflexi bacterium]|nr:toll/interleukin-1 receptor domain-containing protein [Chloroflexota bacterium]
MKLFVSYSRDDAAWVYELWRALRDENHDAWIDKFIKAAADWWETILQQIEAADGVIYIMTSRSVESVYCRAEIDFALALNKPILPLMLKPCDYPPVLDRRRVQFQRIADLSLDRVLFKIEQGLGDIRVDRLNGKYAPTAAARPPVPAPDGANVEDLYELFGMAEEANAAGAVHQADRFFQQVIDADPTPDGVGAAARERLAEIRTERERLAARDKIARMVEPPTLIAGARALWKTYKTKYGLSDEDDVALDALLVVGMTSAGSAPASPAAVAPPVVGVSSPPPASVLRLPDPFRLDRHSGRAGDAD